MAARAAMEAVAIKESVEEWARPKACPVEFATTDRICQRWAVSVGTGLQSDKWQDEIRSRPPPLDDDTAIVVDQIILRLPERTKAVIVKWYRTDLPAEVLARQVGVSPENLETVWHASLSFLQWRFLESKHTGLLKLMRFKD